MKLESLIAFPGLHENTSCLFQVFAGASLSSTELNLKFRIVALTREAFSSILLSRPHAQPERMNELWKQTCFESFVAGKTQPNYLEFNGSSRGDWNLYSFQDERIGMQEALLNEGQEPKLISLNSGEKEIEIVWSMSVQVLVENLSIENTSLMDSLGLSVVLQTKDATTYWALRHENTKPDFHKRASFTYDPIRN
jgi:hypothetical protein